MPVIGNKEDSIWRSSLNVLFIGWSLFSTVLLNITFLKIAFIVVQWENENSVSVVKEKKVVGAVELKEGTTVDISTGTNKGRVAIYKATTLKVWVQNAIFVTWSKSYQRIVIRLELSLHNARRNWNSNWESNRSLPCCSFLGLCFTMK